MAVDHVKAPGITNGDATPRVRNTAGQGGAHARVFVDDGYVTAVASSSADATYQLVRVPSWAKVKSIVFESEAQTAGKFDLGVYYATDGSKKGAATALLAADAIDQDFFATVIDCASAVTPTEVVNESGTNTLDKRGQPLWQAIGLTSDPQCNLDIVATVKTTAVTTGTGKFGARVMWTD
jgi:hypothetical protein